MNTVQVLLFVLGLGIGWFMGMLIVNIAIPHLIYKFHRWRWNVKKKKLISDGASDIEITNHWNHIPMPFDY